MRPTSSTEFQTSQDYIGDPDSNKKVALTISQGATGRHCRGWQKGSEGTISGHIDEDPVALTVLGTYHFALAPDSRAQRMVSTFSNTLHFQTGFDANPHKPISCVAQQGARSQTAPAYSLQAKSALTSNLSLLVAGRCNAKLASREEDCLDDK